MNKTKQNILIKSLELFNEHGIANVSLRDIAYEVGISVGNLQYHLKKRDDIIEVLYFNYVRRVDALFVLDEEITLGTFFKIAMSFFDICAEYKFILLDFSYIFKSNSKIENHYIGILKQRDIDYAAIMKVLIEKKIFREEILKNEYYNLFKRLNIVISFWFSSHLLQISPIFDNSVKDYAPLVGQIVYPYLTEKGRAQYLSVFPDHLI